MKKIIISAFLMVAVLAINAQEYLVNENFASKAKSSASYGEPSFVMAGSAGIILNLISCDFEAIDENDKNGFSQAANDGKIGGQVNVRIADQEQKLGAGSISFTIPAGTKVATVRMFLRAKGKTTGGVGTRTAVITVNGEEENMAGLGIDAGQEWTKIVNGELAEDLTVSVRAAAGDPIILCSIQVTEYDIPANINSTEAQSEKLSVFPNPVKDILAVKNIADGVQTVEIYNVQGMLILSENVNGQAEISIPVATLAEGIYFIKAGSRSCKMFKY